MPDAKAAVRPGCAGADDAGVRFNATTQGVDAGQRNLAGGFSFIFLGSLAEFEQEAILQRVHAGIAAAKAKGVTLRAATQGAIAASCARIFWHMKPGTI